MNSDDHRLPTGVLPRHYDLEIVPDIDSGRFHGSARIRLDVEVNVDELVCNSKELKVASAQLETGDLTRAMSCELDADLERASFSDGAPIEAGPAVLTVEFEGILGDQLAGFYLSHYGSGDERRTIATTQFQATDARRAFPCWDEPALKATFALTLEVEPDHLAVSNTSIVDEAITARGTRRVTFAPTMVMSTYLVAFVVGPLEATPPVDVDGVPVRIIHRPGDPHRTQFGLDVAAAALRFFTEYYAIPYPGDKLDLVAVPDFAFGAMENLGCVTFRDAYLTIDPETATKAEIQRVTDIINHELAHMWFGDLVTMKWWNGIWLNEAFATFMEVSATDAFRPEWRRWDSFSRERSGAMSTDSLQSTRPVEFPVVSPRDAEAMFDVLTYEKGAALVRMLETYLGHDRFREGIRQYLSTYAYGSTETTDLWDALESSTGEPVRRIMDSWIFQGGHPAITVETADQHTGAGHRIELSQKPSLMTGSSHSNGSTGSTETGGSAGAVEPQEPGRLWSVPITGRAPSVDDGTAISARALVDADRGAITFDTEIEPDRLVLNTEANGFMRVAYGPDSLQTAASHAHLDRKPAERFALLDDGWACVLRGEVSPADYLVALETVADDERDTNVWYRIMGGVAGLARLAGSESAALTPRVQAMLSPALDRLGHEAGIEDDDLTLELRGALLDALGRFGDHGPTITSARELFERFVVDPSTVDPALSAGALRVVAAHADRSTWDRIAERFQGATDAQESLRYLYALADPLDADLIAETRELCLSGSVRSQNAPFVLARTLSNVSAATDSWRFVRDHWSAIETAFPSNSLVRMLEGIQTIDDQETASDITAFFAEHPQPQGAQTLAQHIERMTINVEFVRARRAEFLSALSG